MKKNGAVSFLVFFLCLSSFSYTAPLLDGNIDAALNSAESLFRVMKERNYQKIWFYLTRKSKDTLVNDVYKAEENRGKTDLTKEKIAIDFNKGGPLSRSYWNSFLDNFDPDTVLVQSKWDIGKFEKERGEIVIRYRKSESPAILEMYNEQGVWKVGLVETFWARKSAR
jgi:hypothetical protein